MPVTKSPDTNDMIKLYEQGWTYEQIGKHYGIIKQAVSARFARAGVKRRPRKFKRIDKAELEKIYSCDRLILKKIAKHFQTDVSEILKALRFHKIPKRPPVKKGNKFDNFLRKLEIGKTEEITLDLSNPHVRLHASAKAFGIRISMRALGDSKFKVTRIN